MKENFELRLREIKKLKQGWHFGIGETFSDDHIEIAVYLANKYYNKYKLSVSGIPNISGDIELTFSHSDKFLDIFLHSSMKEFVAKHSVGIGKKRHSENWGRFEINMIDDIMQKFNYLITENN